MNNLNFIKQYQINNVDLLDRISNTYKNTNNESFQKINELKGNNTDEDIILFKKEIGNIIGDYVNSFKEIFQNLNPFGFTEKQFPIIHYQLKDNMNPLFDLNNTGKVDYQDRCLTFILCIDSCNEGGINFVYQNQQVNLNKGDILIFPSHFTYGYKHISPSTRSNILVTGYLPFLDKQNPYKDAPKVKYMGHVNENVDKKPEPEHNVTNTVFDDSINTPNYDSPDNQWRWQNDIIDKDKQDIEYVSSSSNEEVQPTINSFNVEATSNNNPWEKWSSESEENSNWNNNESLPPKHSMVNEQEKPKDMLKWSDIKWEDTKN